MPVSVLVSCGSNIEPQKNLRAALERLATLFELRAISRVFTTRAVGAVAVPDFCNAAVEILTDQTAAELKFGTIREIEWQLGRRRSDDRNAPRSIDLDLSLFGDEVIQSEPLGLTVPDPEILTRAHVALPLADVAPDRCHPVSGEALSAIAERLLAGAAPGEIRLAGGFEALRALAGRQGQARRRGG
ncbi:MAG: 2-amino-4-hydroxy-6-hydroxymethyldihydropteridine diphosphokinase [bacterium]|nr:2-amino-4-hydroxy-6-hydroxymethyldihydropteridine diphosphokinase [bacterium]